MAFICTIEHGSSFQLTVLEGNGEYLVRVAVGYDDETDFVYSSFVALAPMAGYTDTKYDISFAIIEAATDESHIAYYRDGTETKTLIPDVEHRKRIRDIVCISIERLIDVCRPDVVNMVTHSSELPAKALAKFHEFASVFAKNGYHSGQCDPWHGMHIWLMKRMDGTDQ